MKFKVKVTVTKDLELDTEHYSDYMDASPEEVIAELNADPDLFYTIAETFFEDAFDHNVERIAAA